MGPKVERLDHIALMVSELDTSTQWYQDVLGLSPVHQDEWWTDTTKFLGAGDTLLALTQASEGQFKSPRNQAPDGHHIAFRADGDSFLLFRDHLSSLGISYEFMDHGISLSFYFSDPDGYRCEITTFDVQDDES
jgi:catechol-2,3-dioxygenase